MSFGKELEAIYATYKEKKLRPISGDEKLKSMLKRGWKINTMGRLKSGKAFNAGFTRLAYLQKGDDLIGVFI